MANVTVFSELEKIVKQSRKIYNELENNRLQVIRLTELVQGYIQNDRVEKIRINRALQDLKSDTSRLLRMRK